MLPGKNNRDENAQIKAGEVPEQFQANTHIKAQKDTDARWAKKNQKTKTTAKKVNIIIPALFFNSSTWHLS
jgi:hypothetical protein